MPGPHLQTPRQTAITAFGRITKSTPLAFPEGKTLKRKAEDHTESPPSARPHRTISVRTRNAPPLPISEPQTPVDTPTRALGGAIKRMKLASASARSSRPRKTAPAAAYPLSSRQAAMSPMSSPTPSRTATPSPSTGPVAEMNSEIGPFHSPPEPVQDVVRMASSVLTSLAMHYAHAGCTSAAPVAQLLETATRLWSRRAVSVDDVQLVFGLLADTATAQPQSAQSLSLVSYNARTPTAATTGVDGLMVELAQPSTTARSILEEAALLRHIEAVLSARWLGWLRQFGCLARTEQFIGCLPRSEIHVTVSVARSSAAARAQKGQAALEFIQSARAGAVTGRAPQPTCAPSELPNGGVQPTPSSLHSRRNLLVQRLEARSALAAASSSAEQNAPAARARRAALSAARHLLRIIRLLLTRDTGYFQNYPFGRPVIAPTTFSVPQVRQAAESATIPLSNIEAGLRLLAELSNGYVKVRQWHGVTAVVVAGVEPTPEQVSSWT